MQTHRKLIATDEPELESLWLAVGTLLKEPYDFTLPRLHELLNIPTIAFYGCFEDGVLVGAIAVKIWNQMPYFTLMNMIFPRQDATGLKTAKMVDSLLGFILNTMHLEGRFTFYFVTLTRIHQLRIFQRTNSIRHAKYFKAFDDYLLYVEEILKPGEVSSHPAFHSICGGKAHARETWIRRYSLKPECREKYLGQYQK